MHWCYRLSNYYTLNVLEFIIRFDHRQHTIIYSFDFVLEQLNACDCSKFHTWLSDGRVDYKAAYKQMQNENFSIKQHKSIASR